MKNILKMSVVSAILAMACAAHGAIVTNLTQHWRLDETDDSQAANAVGGGATGTIVSGVQLNQPGPIGTAYDINGTYGVQLAQALIPATEDFTVAMWLDAPLINDTFFGTAGSKDDGRLQLDVNEAGKSRVLAVTGSTHIVADTAVTGTGWYHCTVTRSSDDWMICTMPRWEPFRLSSLENRPGGATGAPESCCCLTWSSSRSTTN